MNGDDREAAIDRPARDGEPDRCFFLVEADSDSSFATLDESGFPALECRAFPEGMAVSERQRDLVCLTRVHMTCPRYLRANAAVAEVPVEEKRGRATQFLSALFDGALVISLVVIALVAAAALVSPLTRPIAANPTQPPGGGVASAAAGTPSAGITTSAGPGLRTPVPSPSRTGPRSSPSWPPGATASRMTLVKACSDRANCYLYTVRRGENLKRIALFFGVSIDAILAMNPTITNPDYVQAGQTIRIPPPTR